MKNIFQGIGRFHWIAGSLLSVLVIGWVVYQQWSVNNPPEVIVAAVDPTCDLRAGPCETILDDGSRVSFAIEPRAIPMTEKLKLEVTVSGLTVDAVSIDISGVNMKMPPNIVDLRATGHGRYSGQGDLSFCSRSVMEWESIIQLEVGSKIIKVPYRFITSK